MKDNLQELLYEVIATVYDNEEEFLEWAYEDPRYELIGFYMASEACRMELLTTGGFTVVDTVNTSGVLAWCKRIKGDKHG